MDFRVRSQSGLQSEFQKSQDYIEKQKNLKLRRKENAYLTTNCLQTSGFEDEGQVPSMSQIPNPGDWMDFGAPDPSGSD